MKNIVQEKNFAQWAQDYVLLTLSSNGYGRGGGYGNIYMLGALFQGGREQGGGGVAGSFGRVCRINGARMRVILLSHCCRCWSVTYFFHRDFSQKNITWNYNEIPAQSVRLYLFHNGTACITFSKHMVLLVPVLFILILFLRSP